MPQSIGDYRILREIGRGGMGIVYEAEQRNPQRNVALKVVRGGNLVDDHSLTLFHREIQALARLRHPGIAAIYESGCTDDGQHFFAMELVQGVPLDRYASYEDMSVDQRLRLFVQACKAVSYAHQRGVIHRDLKPGNILVDANGMPKILDFGLARITESDIAITTVVTEVGKIQGTLTYMSPEQARGDPEGIDVRSDIYSLGVVLYELVTGRLPYKVPRTMLTEAVRVICQVEPQRLSIVAKSLRGDLETITLKALDKEPLARYQSAGELGADLERYLSSQPILARPPSAVYQLRKLVARHKLPCALIAFALLLVAGFAGSMTLLYAQSARNLARAREAEADARVEADTSQAVSDFLVRMFDQSSPGQARGDTITAREILDRGAERITDDLQGEPRVRAALMHAIGRVYFELGTHDRARSLLESALELRQRELGARHLDVATTLISLASVLDDLGERDEAEMMRREALDIRRIQLGEDHELIAEALNEMGVSKYVAGDIAGSEEYFRKALNMQRRTLGAEHIEVALSLNNLAHIANARGDASTAEGLLRESLAMFQRLLGEDHPAVAARIASLATFVHARGDAVGAEELSRQALTIRRKLYPGDHGALANSLNDLGFLLLERGEYEEAEAMHRDALGMRRRVFGEGHKSVAVSLNYLARARRARGGSRGGRAPLPRGARSLPCSWW